MTAPNHALTGAVIGLAVANPWLALPLAFLSHFVCDVVPHYDLAEIDEVKRVGSRRFLFEFILFGATVCALIVMVLAVAHPHHWIVAAIAAFLAASPDLFWIPRFFRARKGKAPRNPNVFLRFHSRIQWKTDPRLIWLELTWFVLFSGLLLALP